MFVDNDGGGGVLMVLGQVREIGNCPVRWSLFYVPVHADTLCGVVAESRIRSSPGKFGDGFFFPPFFCLLVFKGFELS